MKLSYLIIVLSVLSLESKGQGQWQGQGQWHGEGDEQDGLQGQGEGEEFSSFVVEDMDGLKDHYWEPPVGRREKGFGPWGKSGI